MIKKILVAIDGSKSADRALDFALDLAGKYSSEVMVISVFDAPSVSLVARARAKYLEELRTFHEKLLSETLKRARNFRVTLRVSKKLVEGGRLTR